MIDPAIEEYVEKHTTPEDDVLYELNRQTHLQATKPRMLSGHLQGAFLKMVSHMLKPRRVLEIGTYTGYSAICLSEGIPNGGELITIEQNRELEDFIRYYINKAGRQNVIDIKIGNAIEEVDELKGSFDLVFIDAEKSDYITYYKKILPKLKTGGYILADNALWYGKVVEDTPGNDAEAEGVKAFNDFVHQDPQVENVLLPLRDGIMVLRKVP